MSESSTTNHSTATCHDTYEWGPAPQRRIVVGVDGSPNSVAAVRFAVTEAAFDGSLVEVVFAYDPVATAGVPLFAPVPLPLVALTDETEARRVAEDTVAAAGVEGSGTRLVVKALPGSPPRVLAAVSEGAKLLVVGATGHSALVGRFLGSTAAGCLHRASCPVVVVPAAKRQPEAGDNSSSETSRRGVVGATGA